MEYRAEEKFASLREHPVYIGKKLEKERCLPLAHMLRRSEGDERKRLQHARFKR